MADNVRINGVMHDWASVEARFGNERFSGFSKLTYGQKRTRELVYGADRTRRPRGRTAGKYEPSDVSITLHKDSAEALRAQLAQQSADGRSYGAVEFQIVAQFVAQGVDPITVEINRCLITEESSDHSEGTSALEETWTLQCMEILQNGRSLFDQTTT